MTQKIEDILSNYDLSDWNKTETDNEIIWIRQWSDASDIITNNNVVLNSVVDKITYDKNKNIIECKRYISCPKCNKEMKEISKRNHIVSSLFVVINKHLTKYKCLNCDYEIEG